MARTLGAAIESGRNNFDLIRLLAALGVLASHSYPLSGHGAEEPVRRWLGGYGDGGTLAVQAFFVISGMLVSRSVAGRTTGSYLSARLLRVLPGLAGAVLFQIVVVGLLCTSRPWRDYLASPATWRGLRSITVFDLEVTAPGVFANNPIPASLNGSLWTLPIEALFYLMLPMLALLGGLRRGPILAALVLSWALPWLLTWQFDLSWAAQGPELLAHVQPYPLAACLMFFLAGVALWTWRDRVPIDPALAGIGLIVLWAAAGRAAAPILFPVVFPYLVAVAGLAWPVGVRLMRRLGDLSYGTYLYAFPVEQALVWAHGGAIGPIRLTALAVPLVLGLALLSSRLIERPALALKRGRRRQIAPVTGYHVVKP